MSNVHRRIRLHGRTLTPWLLGEIRALRRKRRRKQRVRGTKTPAKTRSRYQAPKKDRGHWQPRFAKTPALSHASANFSPSTKPEKARPVVVPGKLVTTSCQRHRSNPPQISSHTSSPKHHAFVSRGPITATERTVPCTRFKATLPLKPQTSR
jgi:hypothetical protein